MSTRHLFLATGAWLCMALQSSACLSAAEVRVSAATDPAQAGMLDVRELDADIRADMRYATADNFVGSVVRGYEAPRCYLLRPVAEALARVAADLRAQDLHLLVYDCYRPVRSVAHFVEWAADLEDQRTKPAYYPNLDKHQLLNGYISASSGHSRGATVDLTLVRCGQGECTPLDMGTGFDFFDPLANTDSAHASEAQQANRRLLRDAMQRHGFSNYPMEWWHYSLKPEPEPATAFDFPVR